MNGSEREKEEKGHMRIWRAWYALSVLVDVVAKASATVLATRFFYLLYEHFPATRPMPTSHASV